MLIHCAKLGVQCTSCWELWPSNNALGLTLRVNTVAQLNRHMFLRESAGPGQWNASSVVKGVHSETSGSEVSVLSSSKAGNMNTIPCIKV